MFNFLKPKKNEEISSEYYALTLLELTMFSSKEINESNKTTYKLRLQGARLIKTNPILHFPLFVVFIQQMNNEMPYDYYLIKEDSNEVAFAAKIMFFGNVVGWNILSITIDELLQDDYDYKLKTVSAKGYSMESYIDNFSKDENPDAKLFQIGFKSVALRLIANPTYLKISKGEI